MKNNSSAGTIARTVILVLALLNQCLSFAGISPVPIEDETVSQLVALLLTVGSAAAAWWKNNSFSRAAAAADEVLQAVKSGEVEEEDVHLFVAGRLDIE